MYKVDLNSDLGEGAKFDSEIIPLITSANIACGFHAGGSTLMNKTIKLCRKNGVAAGVHPGYPDRENFGRTNMDVTPDDVYCYTLSQIGSLRAFADANGVKLQHVKPHGAMYNMAAADRCLADAVCDAILDFDKNLILLALSGSQMIESAKDKGIRYAAEVFADRAYESDGSLRSRKLPGAMIEDEDEAVERVIRMITQKKVKTYDNNDIDIEAHSVCVHGDGEKALDFVKKINKALSQNNIITVPIAELF